MFKRDAPVDRDPRLPAILMSKEEVLTVRPRDGNPDRFKARISASTVTTGCFVLTRFTERTRV
jgi:hypothetical protein